MADFGLTHVALLVSDLDASIDFYAKYARMKVVHQRSESATRVAWVSDRTRPFVLVLIETPRAVPARRRLTRLLAKLIPPFSHLGFACAEREEVDRLAAEARRQGILRRGPVDLGPPVGYFALIADPDGNMLEVSFGQDVGLTVERSGSGATRGVSAGSA